MLLGNFAVSTQRRHVNANAFARVWRSRASNVRSGQLNHASFTALFFFLCAVIQSSVVFLKQKYDDGDSREVVEVLQATRRAFTEPFGLGK